MDEANTADLDMIKALLASMHGGGAQMYEENDDEDDDYDDEDDDDDDDDDTMYEHNIQSMVNNYSGDPGGMDDGQMPNIQTMNFLQGLLNMSNGAGGFPGIDAAMGGAMDSNIDMGGQTMESERGFFPSAMQSLVPNMNNEMVGALAGAFGGMGAFVNQPGHDGGDYMGMFEDEEVLSDDEEEEDDEEDDDVDEEIEELGRQQGISMPSGSMLAAAGILAGGAAVSAYQNYHNQQPTPAIMPPPQPMPPLHPPRSDYHNPVAAPVQHNQLANHNTGHVQAAPMSSVAPLRTMSGGTVSQADPFAALAAGVGGVALGAGLLRPIVSNLLSNSGGGTTVVNQVNPSADSMPCRRPAHDAMTSLTSTFGGVNLGGGAHPAICAPDNRHSVDPIARALDDQPLHTTALEKCDDDKASLGSSSNCGSSMASGCGKSDTESVGKKTPIPTNPDGNGGSCASINDLVSATESMRDSDDNHSEAHNLTGNLSELDAEIAEKMHQYTVGPLPFVIEKPTYGWSSMLGLEKAKDALKRLFEMKFFPPVYEGTEGSCKGVLLFGPSGSGKTALARALAKEANESVFVGVSTLYIIKHLPIDAIKLVRCIFEQARHHRPAVILFDDIDALSFHHPSLQESAMAAKQELYAQVRGMTAIPPDYGQHVDTIAMNEGVLVLGTTNKPWLIEDTLRRLFAYNIHVRLPAEKARHGLFRMFLQNVPNRISAAEYDSLVSGTEGYAAAEISTIIRQASLRVQLESSDNSELRHMTYGHIKETMTQFICAFNEDLKKKYSMYIKEATHKQEDPKDSGSRGKKEKPKGVKKISQKIAKSLAAAVLAVID